MKARPIDGRALAAAWRKRVAEEVRRLAAPPRLAVVMVGKDAASDLYVRNKEKAAAEVGIGFERHDLAPDVPQDAVLALIRTLCARRDVTGLIVQLPLPAHVDRTAVLRAVDPAKDVDGFHPENLGLVMMGAPRFVPATPLAIVRLLKEEGVKLKGANVTIVNHSTLIGRPLAAMLLTEDATVVVCHQFTRDLPVRTARADVLVTAAGVPGLITPQHVAPGAVVIDAATVYDEDGNLVGDVGPGVEEVAGALTPVPGGVGPVTVAALLSNVALAARLSAR